MNCTEVLLVLATSLLIPCREKKLALPSLQDSSATFVYVNGEVVAEKT